MKVLSNAIVMLNCAIFTILIGCVSTNGTRSDYFGYNNSPRQSEQTSSQSEDRSWSNPIRSNQSVVSTDYYAVDRASYGYIPVIVPWWDSYYAWPGFSRSGISIGFYYGSPAYYYPPFYPWYSPWYDYNPFYGGICRYPYYTSWHRPWYNDSWRPAAPYVPVRTGTRDFGSHRADFTPANNNNGRNSGSSDIITSGNRLRTGAAKDADIPNQIELKDQTSNRTRTTNVKSANIPNEVKVYEKSRTRENVQYEPQVNSARTNRSREAVATPPAPRYSPAPSTNTHRRKP